MNNKIITAFATAGIVVSSFVPAAFAENGITISDNGNNSENTVKVEEVNANVISQTNTTEAITVVGVLQNTGLDTANGNTGAGDVSNTSGSATARVVTTVTGGDNTATAADNCGCGDEANIKISDNGNGTTNKVVDETLNLNLVRQKTKTQALTVALIGQNTGLNKANNNTGKGSVTVKSKKATAKVITTVQGGSNKLK